MRPSSPSEATLPRGCAGQSTGRVSGGPGNVRCSCDQPARPCAIATADRSPRAHRVAHAAPPLRPWEQFASLLAEGLVAAGHDVTLFATADSVTTARLRSTSPCGWNEDDSIEPKVAEALHIAASSSTPPTSTSSTTASTSCRSPTAGSSTRRSSRRSTASRRTRILPAYERYDDTTAYVAISDADRHPALHYAATIHHGIDTAAFAVDPEPGDHLLFFGRIHPDKGTATAIDVAARAGRRLVIAGIIHDQRYYDEQVAPHVDGDTVRYIGPVTAADRSAVLGAAHALLHLIDFDEPFGYSVVEALACGTPVIAHRRGSMPELITDGVTGFLVDGTEEAVASDPRRRLARPTHDPGSDRRPLRQEHDDRPLRRRLPIPPRPRLTSSAVTPPGSGEDGVRLRPDVDRTTVDNAPSSPSAPIDRTTQAPSTSRCSPARPSSGR